jgi:hypothetical protein
LKLTFHQPKRRETNPWHLDVSQSWCTNECSFNQSSNLYWLWIRHCCRWHPHNHSVIICHNPYKSICLKVKFSSNRNFGRLKIMLSPIMLTF